MMPNNFNNLKMTMKNISGIAYFICIVIISTVLLSGCKVSIGRVRTIQTDDIENNGGQNDDSSKIDEYDNIGDDGWGEVNDLNKLPDMLVTRSELYPAIVSKAPGLPLYAEFTGTDRASDNNLNKGLVGHMPSAGRLDIVINNSGMMEYDENEVMYIDSLHSLTSDGRTILSANTGGIYNFAWSSDKTMAAAAAVEGVFIFYITEKKSKKIRLPSYLEGKIQRVYITDGGYLHLDTEAHGDIYTSYLDTGLGANTLFTDRNYIYHKFSLSDNEVITAKRSIPGEEILYYTNHENNTLYVGPKGLLMDKSGDIILVKKGNWKHTYLSVWYAARDNWRSFYIGGNIINAEIDPNGNFIFCSIFEDGEFILKSIDIKSGGRWEFKGAPSGDFLIEPDGNVFIYGLNGGAMRLIRDVEGNFLRVEHIRKSYSDMRDILITLTSAVNIYQGAYSGNISSIFTNTTIWADEYRADLYEDDDYIIQSALTRINEELLEVEDRDSLLTDQLEYGIKTISIDGNKAFAELDDFYYNSHQLINVNGDWKITGFSTRPKTLSRHDIYNSIKKITDGIVPYKWRSNIISSSIMNVDSKVTFIDIFDDNPVLRDYLNDGQLKFVIGEISFWRDGIEHRTSSSQTANMVKVQMKMIRTIYGRDQIIADYTVIVKRSSSSRWLVEGIE